MNKIIEKYISKLEENKKNPFVKECIETLLKDEIILNRDHVSTINKLIEQYTDRFNIQKEIIKKETVFGYEFLLNELKKYDGKEYVRSSIFSNADNGFVVLQLEEEDKIIAVLKSLNINLIKDQKLIKLYKQRGLTANYLRFSKGILLPTLPQAGASEIK